MPHIHKEYDFVVDVFIVHEGKVLLVDHPRYGVWIPMGGHVELDEDPEEALFREVAEETGLEVEVLADKPDIGDDKVKFIYAPHYIDVHEANPPHKHIGLTYFVRAKSPDFTKSDEHNELKWFSIEELDDPKYNLSKSVKFYCHEALKADRN